MGIADKVLGAIPGVRRWWWRRKWTSLDVPAEEWARLDDMTEDLNDILKNVRALETLIMNASIAQAGHGMNVKSVWSDLKGKERTVDIILDGTAATASLMEGYHKEMDARRREMMDIATEMSQWAAKNAVVRGYEEKPPLRVRFAGFIRDAARILKELNAATEGRTPDEFLRYALLDETFRASRLKIESPPEPVKLEKPEETEKPVEKPSEKKKGNNDAQKKAALLPKAFAEQGIDARFVSFAKGYSVTRYRLKLEEGQKLSKVESLSKEIALRMGVKSVAISPSPNEAQIVLVDVPNEKVEPLSFGDVKQEAGQFFVGMPIEGDAVYTDMESLCHVLIAGTTGSGKSTFLNTLICSVIQSFLPFACQFIMIDPKQVELTPYDGIPHLARPVATDPAEAVTALDEAVKEMNRRYELFKDSGVKKLSEYNDKAKNPLPRLIVVIDELSDLMMVSEKEVEASIIRIAQLGRAAGIHLVIATQRPTKDVVTGLIKANIPSRIAFAVASAMESRIILDEAGAEKLRGNGDMLFKPNGGTAQRLQGAYISPEEIERVTRSVVEEGFL